MMKVAICLFKTMLSLRYSVRISGLNLLDVKAPILILPNHQALIDPQLVIAHLYNRKPMAPVITEGMSNIPLVINIFKKMKAIPVSDLSAGSRDITVLSTITHQILQHLNNGGAVLLYPAGQIASQGKERIANKQSAWLVCKNVPPGTVVLGLRIRGLWGSMWSRANTGKSPALVKTYLRALGLVVANLVFFAPRRVVTFEIEDITELVGKESQQGKAQFNKALEDFYNSRGEEPLSRVPRLFYVYIYEQLKSMIRSIIRR